MVGYRCVGHVMESFKGFQAFDARDKSIGVFPDAEMAVRRLRSLASEAST